MFERFSSSQCAFDQSLVRVTFLTV